MMYAKEDVLFSDQIMSKPKAEKPPSQKPFIYFCSARSSPKPKLYLGPNGPALSRNSGVRILC